MVGHIGSSTVLEKNGFVRTLEACRLSISPRPSERRVLYTIHFVFCMQPCISTHEMLSRFSTFEPWTSCAGPVPEALGKLTNLRKLILNDNRLTGKPPLKLVVPTCLSHYGSSTERTNFVRAWKPRAGGKCGSLLYAGAVMQEGMFSRLVCARSATGSLGTLFCCRSTALRIHIRFLLPKHWLDQ